MIILKFPLLNSFCFLPPESFSPRSTLGNISNIKLEELTNLQTAGEKAVSTHSRARLT